MHGSWHLAGLVCLGLAKIQGAVAEPLPATSTLRETAEIRRTTHPAPTELAYLAFKANRFEDARSAYADILRHEHHNLDALLGLAMIAASQHKTDEAATWYLRVLDVAPLHPTALAAIIDITPLDDAALSEGRLKTALASQPASSLLWFALGNLFARQQRWREAQQAYLSAARQEENNPDMLFNLAVSLDHLHQGSLAAQYYQKALDARQSNRQPTFNPDQARLRRLQLRPLVD